MRSPVQAVAVPRMAFRLLMAGVAAVFVASALTPAALAQARDVATTAVVTFADKSGRGSELLQAKATDAVALALADSKEYLVTPGRDVEREMQALSLRAPLSKVEAQRLGRRLDVDVITSGEILQATVDERSGTGRVRLQIMMLDVASAEYLDGSVVATETKSAPGWAGTEADILNETIREAAEDSVSTLLASRVPRGTVEVVLPSGKCEINLGSQDGARPGMKLVVLRPIYLRELEKVTLRKIGRVEISETQADICYADAERGVSPRTGDYVLRVYEPLAVAQVAAAKESRTEFVAGLGALLLLGALVGIASGGSETSSPPTPISYLHQGAMGDTPVIRVDFAVMDKGFGHLLFRGHSAGFPADAPYLVEVSGGTTGEESIKYMDDDPAAQAQQDRTITVYFRDEDGDPTTEDVDCTWTHPPLVQGESYYHKMRRVTKPAFPPGTNPPLATGGVDRVAQDPTNTIDVGGDFPMISKPTIVCGPVTYITAALQRLPTDNYQGQDTQLVHFEWEPTIGADEYMVEVFDATDPDGLGQAVFHREGIRARGATRIYEDWYPAAGDLQEDAVYYWRVGARKSLESGAKGQGVPRVGYGSREVRGWVLSYMRSFRTALMPPPPVSSGNTDRIADPAPIKPGASQATRAERQRQQQAAQRRANRRTRQQTGPQAPPGAGFATPFPQR